MSKIRLQVKADLLFKKIEYGKEVLLSMVSKRLRLPNQNQIGIYILNLTTTGNN